MNTQSMRFSLDNTEGYTQSQLDTLNELYEAVVDKYEMEIGRKFDAIDLYDKSMLDMIAEQCEISLYL